ncbi:MAG: gamma-glutamyltransferase family protein [Opitutus sp.]|nr:gamma-glutamyltransferase family protein [Opitutus sp.]
MPDLLPLKFLLVLSALALLPPLARCVPVEVVPVTALHGMVVAAHPQAAAIGVEVLKRGGNAIDAGVAVSLAVGVAEPYGSGLGGKFMLLYREARSGKTVVIEAMDACGSALDVAAYLKLPKTARSQGYSSVCVPGLAAGLWAAHQKWGAKKWADNIAPVIALAREGFEVLPKTRDQFDEQDEVLHRGDAEIARLYLPGGAQPVIGTLLQNADLAHTMELLAQQGRDGFYRGEVAEKIVAASQKGGGVLTLADFANYQVRVTEPLALDFRGYRMLSAPPPAHGASLFLTVMKVLEADDFGGGPLRSPAALDRIGRVWRVVEPPARQVIADSPKSRASFERLISPASIRALREASLAPTGKPTVSREDGPFYESPMAATTQWMVVDAAGNIACCTQSQSLHFGAGVVAPGTGVVLNDSMTNFSFDEPRSLNFIAPGRRPRSTISPTLVERQGRPVFAIGVPGSSRIPTAMLQVLLDRLALNRPLVEAIGDTRFHFARMTAAGAPEAFESERSLPAETTQGLRERGWNIGQTEEAGRGRRFGGVNAIEFNADGTLTGLADPRRTNAAAGY